MPGLAMRQTTTQPVAGDVPKQPMPVPAPPPPPVQDPDTIDPAQQPPVEEPDVGDPSPSPEPPPMIARH